MSSKILIVEDEPSLLNSLNEKFIQKGFQTLTAVNGQEGLVSAYKNHPDIILLDIIMPVMDGMTMLNELRKDAWGKDAKVILLTNLTDVSKETKSSNQEVCDYLIKADWTLEDIVKKVESRLSLG